VIGHFDHAGRVGLCDRCPCTPQQAPASTIFLPGRRPPPGIEPASTAPAREAQVNRTSDR
jgi:hypothetical protein